MIKKLAASILGITSILSLAFLSSCTTTTDSTDSTSSIYMIVLMVVLFGVFYFFIIRPQNKRQKEQMNLLSNLKVGDRIITIGGMYGRIETVRDDSFIIKVESGALIRMAKNSIAGKQPEDTLSK